jgi:hypothetical protein
MIQERVLAQTLKIGCIKVDSFAPPEQMAIQMVSLVHHSLPKRHSGLGIAQICPANFSLEQKGAGGQP